MNKSPKTPSINSGQKPTEPQQIGMDSTVNNVVSFLTNAPRQSIVYRFLVMVAAVVVIGYGVSAASKIIGPMFLALFLAIILLVPLQWMQKKGCPKIIALIIVIVFTVIIFVGISYHVAKSLNYLVAKSPEYKANLEAKIAAIDKRLEQIGIAISGLTAWRIEKEKEKGYEENIDNDEVDESDPELPVDKNQDSNNRFNNSKKIVPHSNDTPNLETPSNNSRSNNTSPDINTITNPVKPSQPNANNINTEPAASNNNVKNNRNVNSDNNKIDNNSIKDSDKNSANGESGKVIVVPNGVGDSNVAEQVAQVADAVANGAAPNTEKKGNGNDPDSVSSDIETTSLSEFLGGSRVGFGFLKEESDKPPKESVTKTRRDFQSKEKSQLILLNSQDVMVWLRTSLIAIREIGESAFLVLIFTIFMVFEAASFPTKVDRAFGLDGPINNQHLQRIAGEIRRYLFLKAISSMMSAVTATIVYWFFGVPAMFFWGLVAFFLYFIPNVGGILASIIPGLLIFMTHDWQGVAIYAVCLVCMECTIGYGIEPKMLGHGLGISTVVILLSLFTWGMLLGPIGLFMAAPLTIMVKITLQAFKETEWIATLIDRK